MNLNFILDDTNFPLKERKLPDLCADRIDYILRDAAVSHEMDSLQKDYVLAHLHAEKGIWFFDDLASAQFFKDLFRQMDKKYYASIDAAAMHVTVGFYLRHALEEKYINWDDLYTTDCLVLDKIALHHGHDGKLRLLFERMNMKYGFFNDPDNYHAHTHCKSRLVDPLFLDGENLKRVSDVDPGWAEIMKSGLEPKEYFIRFEK